jgi:hypothetical protein
MIYKIKEKNKIMEEDIINRFNFTDISNLEEEDLKNS